MVERLHIRISKMWCTSRGVYVHIPNEWVCPCYGQTPEGDTEEIKLIKQDTVCVVSTDCINKMGSYNELDGTRFPIFVDDKLGMANIKTIEELNWWMSTLEVTKNISATIKMVKLSRWW